MGWQPREFGRSDSLVKFKLTSFVKAQTENQVAFLQNYIYNKAMIIKLSRKESGMVAPAKIPYYKR